MFKNHRGLSPDILGEMFVPKIGFYNLPRNHTFERSQVHSVYRNTESLSFLGLKIWDLVPLELKQLETREVFILKIKKWIAFGCLAYCVKLSFVKAVRVTMFIDYYYQFYYLRCLYDNIYIYIYIYIYIKLKNQKNYLLQIYYIYINIVNL